MLRLSPPKSQAMLYNRAQKLAGCSLGHLARQFKVTLPDSLHQAKGTVGMLLEIALGAYNANSPLPDFVHLGIELKTLPLRDAHLPKESTFVCKVPSPLSGVELNWKTSRVFQKLNKVLWIPIESDNSVPIAQRKILTPILFELANHPFIEKILKQDFEELTEMLLLGDLSLTAHFGEYLQIRPKASHSKITQPHFDLEGNATETVPKGFYLRTTFTKALLRLYSNAFYVT